MTRAVKNYIYYRSEAWRVNSKDYLPNDQKDSVANMVAAYKENADKMDAAIGLNSLPDNFVDQVQDLLDFRNTDVKIATDKINNEFFNEISNFVSKDLLNYTLVKSKGITVGNAHIRLNKTMLSIKEAREMAVTLNKVIDKIDEFDEGFATLGKDGMDVSFLNNSGLVRTKKAYDNLKKLVTTLNSANSTAGLQSEMRNMISVFGQVIGNLKGGLFEYADFMHSMAIAQAVEKVEKEVKIVGGQLTSTSDTYIPSAILAAEIGQGKFTNKADNVVTVFGYDKNNVQMELDLGISDKSFSSKKAKGRNIARSVSWSALMQQGGMSESELEYYYANYIVHGKALRSNKVFEPTSKINKLIAARASSFLISGVAGGTTSQAYFIRYSNELLYVPDLLRNIGTNKDFLSLSHNSSGAENIFVGNPNKLSMEDAWIRSRNTMSSIRSKVKFSASR